MIHKTAYNHQKSWHKYLDFILWALRESPQAGTGVPPWVLAFRRLPKGPCATLKDVWVGDDELPLDLGSSVTEFMRDLRNKLAVANEYANEHLNRSQQQWATRYNLRTRPKSFQVGDQVLILVSDSTYSRL
jgi:hypothetical protein